MYSDIFSDEAAVVPIATILEGAIMIISLSLQPPNVCTFNCMEFRSRDVRTGTTEHTQQTHLTGRSIKFQANLNRSTVQVCYDPELHPSKMNLNTAPISSGLSGASGVRAS